MMRGNLPWIQKRPHHTIQLIISTHHSEAWSESLSSQGTLMEELEDADKALCEPRTAFCSGEDTLLGEELLLSREDDRKVGMVACLREREKGLLPHHFSIPSADHSLSLHGSCPGMGEPKIRHLRNNIRILKTQVL
jgi:hypothetical protein